MSTTGLNRYDLSLNLETLFCALSQRFPVFSPRNRNSKTDGSSLVSDLDSEARKAQLKHHLQYSIYDKRSLETARRYHPLIYLAFFLVYL